MNDTQVSFMDVLGWSDDQCREYLEAMRWPEGPHCPKCGAMEPWKLTRKSKTKNVVTTLYRCRECKRQFTATVGTIFEDSKIPLSKWFAAIYLMCSSKKGMSAHQMHRQLHITYKSAWFMCHRIREAMEDKSFPQLTGTVEADETSVGGKPRGNPAWKVGVKKGNPAIYSNKAVVFGMLERGGTVRTMVVPETTRKQLEPILTGYIDTSNARLMTDSHPVYKVIRNHLPHQVVDHRETYVVGDVHTQGIENCWSIMKRGLYGVFHHVDAQYLPQYLNEFEYRFNRRKIPDEDRFVALLAQTQGRVTWFCRTPQPKNPHA